MKIELIDERNAVSEDAAPAYRAVFEREREASTYRLTGCTVLQALNWAIEQADGRQYSLWLEHPVGETTDLVALSLLERSQ